MSVSRKEHPWVLLLLLVCGCTLSPKDAKPADSGVPEGTGTTDSTPTNDTDPTDTDTSPTDSGPPDADGDGSSDADDCDDADPEVYPGAPERCNGVDDDCDGAVELNCITTEQMDYRIVSSYGPRIGAAMDTPGDVDGDGLDDLLIYDSWLTTDLDQRAAAYTALVLGSTLTARDLDIADIAAAQFQGTADDSQYEGSMIGLGGDMDGDGLPDLAMVGTSSTAGEGVGIFTAATMFAGGAWLHAEDADIWIPGPAYLFLDPIADLDGDGTVDLLGTERSDEGGLAKVRGISGATIAGGADFAEPMFELDAIADSGVDPAAGGDVDGDGLSDLVYSDQTGCGGVEEGCWRLFLGATLAGGGSFEAADADAWWWSESIRVHPMSSPPAIYTDLSGDGLAEVVVHADSRTYLGLFVGSGDSGSVQESWITAADGVRFGHLPQPPVGDLDGDGLGDLQLYVSDRDADRSGIAVFTSLPAGGAIDVDEPDLVVLGEGADAGFDGGHLGRALDIDGDGLSDLYGGVNYGLYGEAAALVTRSSGLHW